MDKIVRDLKQKPLSNHDMQALFDDTVNIITYPELAEVKHLDQIWGSSGAVIILYETSESFGHWCCLFKREDGKTIEFFDSLGSPDGPYIGAPDAQLKFIKPHFRRISNQYVPHLTVLIKESPYRCVYSAFRLQKNARETNTCGRWVTARLLMRELTAEQFAKLFLHQKMDPDSYVTLMTAFY